MYLQLLPYKQFLSYIHESPVITCKTFFIIGCSFYLVCKCVNPFRWKHRIASTFKVSDNSNKLEMQSCNLFYASFYDLCKWLSSFLHRGYMAADTGQGIHTAMEMQQMPHQQPHPNHAVMSLQQHNQPMISPASHQGMGPPAAGMYNNYNSPFHPAGARAESHSYSSGYSSQQVCIFINE